MSDVTVINKKTTKDTGLVTVAELYGDLELEVGHKDPLTTLLNQKPHPLWEKRHPMIPTLRYIPIERIEWLLTAIFKRWHVEIKETQLIANSVVVTVRLHYWNEKNQCFDFQDGVGAAPIQTDKDTGAIDFMRMKTNAIQLAAPAAESYAIKDAAEKIGRIFGRDISRKSEMDYDFFKSDISYWRDKLTSVNSVEELKDFYEANKGGGESFAEAIKEKKKELDKNNQ